METEPRNEISCMFVDQRTAYISYAMKGFKGIKIVTKGMHKIEKQWTGPTVKTKRIHIDDKDLSNYWFYLSMNFEQMVAFVVTWTESVIKSEIIQFYSGNLHNPDKTVVEDDMI